MQRNPVINAAAITAETGIPVKTIRKWLTIYPGTIRISPLGVANPRLGLRQNGVDAFVDWLTKQPTEAINPKKEPQKAPEKPRGKPTYVPSGGPIPYRKSGGKA